MDSRLSAVFTGQVVENPRRISNGHPAESYQSRAARAGVRVTPVRLLRGARAPQGHDGEQVIDVDNTVSVEVLGGAGGTPPRVEKY